MRKTVKLKAGDAKIILNNNFKKKKVFLTFWRLRIRIAENLVLVTKHIVVDVEFVCNSTLKDKQTVHQLLLQQNTLIKLPHTHWQLLAEVKNKPQVPAQKSAWTSSWAACCWTAHPSLAPPHPRSGWREHQRAWSWCDSHGSSEPSPSYGSPGEEECNISFSYDQWNTFTIDYWLSNKRHFLMHVCFSLCFDILLTCSVCCFVTSVFQVWFYCSGNNKN